MEAMRVCSCAMACLWRMISWDWRSSALMAAILSACSRRRASSICRGQGGPEREQCTPVAS